MGPPHPPGLLQSDKYNIAVLMKEYKTGNQQSLNTPGTVVWVLTSYPNLFDSIFHDIYVLPGLDVLLVEPEAILHLLLQVLTNHAGWHVCNTKHAFSEGILSNNCIKMDNKYAPAFMQ